MVISPVNLDHDDDYADEERVLSTSKWPCDLKLLFH